VKRPKDTDWKLENAPNAEKLISPAESSVLNVVQKNLQNTPSQEKGNFLLTL
jgi:hypothetical protein